MQEAGSREFTSFVCAVISGIAVDIFEEQGAEQWRCAEDGIAEVPATRQPVSLVWGPVGSGRFTRVPTRPGSRGARGPASEA